MMSCKICGDKGYTDRNVLEDDSSVYCVCECTGINESSFKKLCEDIKDNGGEIAVEIE